MLGFWGFRVLGLRLLEPAAFLGVFGVQGFQGLSGFKGRGLGQFRV